MKGLGDDMQVIKERNHNNSAITILEFSGYGDEVLRMCQCSKHGTSSKSLGLEEKETIQAWFENPGTFCMECKVESWKSKGGEECQTP